jgi:pyruvate/2-oxoacid:ferredoxin oxidoreductase alpha subunit
VGSVNPLQEVKMRAVLPLALFFVFAGAVEAQEVPQSAAQVETAEAVRPIDAYQPKPALEPAPRLQPTTVQTPAADAQGTEATQRQLETRAADAPVMMRQAPGMTWWWLVAAIVVGGLIIVAIT